jgi:uncharacterized membrane protein
VLSPVPDEPPPPLELRWRGSAWTARRRLVIMLACAVVAFVPAIVLGPWQLAELVAWDAAALAFVVLAALVIYLTDDDDIAAVATMQDDTRHSAGLIILGAGLASLVGVALALVEANRAHGLLEVLLTAACALTVVLSWAVVQAHFTLHYARLYYTEPVGGVDFNGDEPPDYLDFAYLALTIGMTYQVSDTGLGNRNFRRSVTRQALLSYLFGAFIIATTINVVAGFLR